METKPILDACCGSRMFWFDHKNPNAVFVDKRICEAQVIWKSGDGKSVRYCSVKPDIQADFRNLPFPDESFWHIIFDPPHLLKIGDTAWMAKKYGKLPQDWQSLIHDGFRECWRVLKTNGTLIFKWNAEQIPVRKVIACIGIMPLYGHKSGKLSKTHWMAFVKLQNGNQSVNDVTHQLDLFDDLTSSIECVEDVATNKGEN